MVAPKMPSSEQYGLGSPGTLQKIDKLFACGVGELVNLPQIVVVGDQSSGKSSVLEGLIKKPLPRDSGLCTRFATQIVFRRALRVGIVVSIIPERDASPERTSRLKTWGKSVPSLDSKAFVDIMDEVHDVMGLSKGTNEEAGNNKPTFSNDVLRLEISGPDQEHFSVIDVPGIFKSTTAGVTTKNDIQLVRNMVKGYMDNPRSVILGVIPANVDVATQEILELAAEADPQQYRTLGVLTKPDLVDKGAEPKVIDLLSGHTRPMKLGWHMIRNPGQMEMSDKSLDRDSLESNFFRSKAPWDTIEKGKVGIDALRLHLNEVLSLIVKREFPAVKNEIKTRLEVRVKKLEELGPDRSGPPEQIAYLTNIATRFQRLVGFALNASHGADSLFDTTPELRISPAIMSRMKVFSEDMFKYGQTFAFLPEKKGFSFAKSAPDVGNTAAQKQGETSLKTPAATGSQSPAGFLSKTSTFGNPTQLGSANQISSSAKSPQSSFPEVPHGQFEIRKVEDHEDLQDILHSSSGQPGPKPYGIEDWLLQVFVGHRGFELGTFNASILSTVMKKQSAKWKDISLGFVSDVTVMVHRFVETALTSVCSDDDVCRALLNTIFDELVQRYQQAFNNTRFLLEVENSNTPMTLNHYFNDNLQKSRQEKVVAALQKSAFKDDYYGMVIKLDQAVQTQAMSNDEHVILEIHDITKAYYKVSCKTFVDSVSRQAVLYHLLQAEKGPLALFSPTFVSQLSAAQLGEIAGEAPAQKRHREQLTKEVASLKEATKILGRG